MMKKKNTTSRLNKVDYLIFSICSVFAVVSLVLFFIETNSLYVKQNEKPIAVISLKENKVERKLIDHNVYEKVRLNTDIYDGDIIRTEDKSQTVADFFSNGTSIKLNENSIIQVFQDKKKSSIDFISGDIQLKNNSSDNEFVIYTGSKEISIKRKSEVKITVINHPVENIPVEASIDVVSGEVEISETEHTAGEQSDKRKKSVRNKKSEKQTIFAGTQITLNFEEAVSEKNNQTEISENLNQSVEEDQNKSQEEIIETSENVAQEIPLENNNEAEISEDPFAPAKEIIQVNDSKTFSKDQESAVRNFYNEAAGKYNHEFDIRLSDVLPGNKRIPNGAAIEVAVSGIADKNLKTAAIQISNGNKVWKRAHTFRWDSINNSLGTAPGKPFAIKKIILVQDDIINTSGSTLSFSYEPNILNEQVDIKNLAISARIIDLEAGAKIAPVASGYTKTLECEKINFFNEVYDDGTSCNVFYINTEELFGTLKSLPKGTKVKVSVSGTLAEPNPWMSIVLGIGIFPEGWDSAFDSGKMGDPGNVLGSTGGTGKNFSYSHKFTINSSVNDTSSACFKFHTDGNRKPIPSISNFKLTVEVL